MSNKDTDKKPQFQSSESSIFMPSDEVNVTRYTNDNIMDGAKYGTRSTGKPHKAPKVNLSGASHNKPQQ